ncbi:MAG: thiamine pyrophosphate-binding protein [Nocardioides sp.]|uniref:thiamine pyrophosphate-binding protein n=1 Tax=Nocardioides sp. TaxID=35761 RepID=UPI0039E4240C
MSATTTCTGRDAEDPLVAIAARVGFTLVTGVPDSPLSEFASALSALAPARPGGLDYVPGTREDSCLAVAAGEALAGGRPLVFMKSAGFGNCLDVLTSLVQVYSIPVVLLVSWAGHAGRDVPHHNVIGEPLQALCDAVGLPTRVAALDDAADLELQLMAAAEAAARTSGPVAVLGIPAGL